VASLLTGLFPETHTAKDGHDKLPATVPLASEHLSLMGFDTAAFIANGYVSQKFGFKKGWNTWTNYVREGKPNRAEFVFKDAEQWLEKRTDEKPFFLYVHTIDPHVPYIPPKKYIDIYDSLPYRGPVKPRETAKLLERIKTGSITLSPRDKIHLEALYDAEISYHDDSFVHLYDKMQELGLLEDTLIIVTSDHGEEFFEHGLVGHGHSLYEELLHVPLIVKLPGGVEKRMAENRSETSLVDVLPTAYEILGVEKPEELEGVSLVPLLGGKRWCQFPDASFAEYLEGHRAVRSGRYKLVYKGLKTSLFDLETDPRETTDMSAQKPVALATMRDLMGKHLGRFIQTYPGESEGKTRKQHSQEKTKIDPKTRRQLKALGYLGGE
jgi:arylsulfatase A-like enzyme